MNQPDWESPFFSGHCFIFFSFLFFSSFSYFSPSLLLIPSPHHFSFFFSSCHFPLVSSPLAETKRGIVDCRPIPSLAFGILTPDRMTRGRGYKRYVARGRLDACFLDRHRPNRGRLSLFFLLSRATEEKSNANKGAVDEELVIVYLHSSPLVSPQKAVTFSNFPRETSGHIRL